MRSKLSMRSSRRLQIATGAILFAAPASAVSLSTGPADAQTAASGHPLQVTLDKHYVPYGRMLNIRGRADASDRGRSVLLQFESAGSSAWQSFASARIHSDGTFRVRSAINRSGSVRVVAGPLTARPASASADRTAAATGGVVIAPSPESTVTSGSVLSTASGSFSSVGGRPVSVAGALLPRGAGRVVSLEARSGRGWRRVASARTRPNGHFTIKWTPSGGSRVVRVRFAGDKHSAALASGRHQVSVLHGVLASWYNDGGNTGCGFHAGMGVANKTLPCGTKVTLEYGGRTVVATVDDRGPYVGGREYDLNQNVAAALGFGGVGTVESSI